MRGYRKGFTIVELVVVIAVIGILASLTLIGLSRYQTTTRDNVRVDKATVITEALEKYYDNNGEYPTCGQLSQAPSIVATQVLVGIDAKALSTPTASGTVNSIQCIDKTTLATYNGASSDIFAYTGDGSDACKSMTYPIPANSSLSCLQYTLSYKDETKNTFDPIQSRRNTNILTSGDIADLSGTGTGFTSIGLTWSPIPNASSYTIETATDAGFTTNVVDSTVTTSNATLGATKSDGSAYLVQNTAYYIRVKPVSPGSVGNWSNVTNPSTWNLAKPTLTLVADTTSQITASWGAVTHTGTYTLRYSTASTVDSNGILSTGTTLANLTSGTLSKSVTSLSSGTLYYFQLEPTASGYTGHDLSDVTSRATKLLAPTGLAVSSVTSSSVHLAWNAVTGATQYGVNWSTTSDFSSNVSGQYAPTATTDVTGLSTGVTWYFHVFAVGPTNSDFGSSVSAKTLVDAPSAQTITGPVGSPNGAGWAQWYWSAPACTNGASAVYWWVYGNNSTGSFQYSTNPDGTTAWNWLGTTTSFNGTGGSAGVTYAPAILTACQAPSGAQSAQVVSYSPGWYNPVGHNAVYRIDQRYNNNTGTQYEKYSAQYRVTAMSSNCAAGLTNTMQTHISYGYINDDTNGSRVPQGAENIPTSSFSPVVINGVISAGFSQYNVTSDYAEAYFYSACVNVTTGANADQYGNGSIVSNAYWGFGTLKVLYNASTSWRVICRPTEYCDNQFQLYKTGSAPVIDAYGNTKDQDGSGELKTKNVGCTKGTSSDYWPFSGGQWTSFCQ